MNGAAKFALGLILLWLGMVAFYFAFHPNGVQGVSNPADALQWLIKEFQTNTGTGSATNATTSPNNVGASPAAGGA